MLGVFPDQEKQILAGPKELLQEVRLPPEVFQEAVAFGTIRVMGRLT